MHLKLPIALVLAVSLATPATAAPRPQQSWGKAGVSLEDYRNDAVECASMAYYSDVSGSPQARAFIRGTKQFESIDGLPMDMYEMARRYGQIEQSVRPERQMHQLQIGMQQVVDICLERRGYSRFALTEAQRKKLGKLKKGSAERHRYMHALASDPAILRAQPIVNR